MVYCTNRQKHSKPLVYQSSQVYQDCTNSIPTVYQSSKTVSGGFWSWRNCGNAKKSPNGIQGGSPMEIAPEAEKKFQNLGCNSSHFGTKYHSTDRIRVPIRLSLYICLYFLPLLRHSASNIDVILKCEIRVIKVITMAPIDRYYTTIYIDLSL